MPTNGIAAMMTLTNGNTAVIIDNWRRDHEFVIIASSILKCIRLCAYSDDKVRPLLITMSGEDTRDGMLRMGKDFGLSGRRYSRIGIAPDFTPKQREENRKLLEEAKAAIMENGESPENYKLYVIRRSTWPQVIKRKQHKVVQRIQ